jgi:hypothetical protein
MDCWMPKAGCYFCILWRWEYQRLKAYQSINRAVMIGIAWWDKHGMEPVAAASGSKVSIVWIEWMRNTGDHWMSLFVIIQ